MGEEYTRYEMKQHFDILIKTKAEPISNYPKAFVYALLDEKEIVYIGKTTSGIARVYSHTSKKEFNEYAIMDWSLFCENEKYFIAHIKEYESLLIMLFNPKYNKTLSTQEHFCTLSRLIDQFKLSDSQIIKITKNVQEYYCSDKPYYNICEALRIIEGE
jgi:hypothetical protein